MIIAILICIFLVLMLGGDNFLLLLGSLLKFAFCAALIIGVIALFAALAN